MPPSVIHSDQLYNWSAHEPFHRHLAPPASRLGRSTGRTGAAGAAGLLDRALQTLRPRGLQMSADARSWTQILPLHQSGRRAPGDGLRARGAGPASRRLFEKLPEGPPTAGEDLQSQPSVITTPSEVLISAAHGAFIRIPTRPRLGWVPRRQLAPKLAASRLDPSHTTSNSGDRAC